MCAKFFTWLLLLLFAFSSLAIVGCRPERIGDIATTISTAADTITPYVPPPASWIGYTVSALASAVAAIAYGIKERRGKNSMRKGLQAVGKVIDHAKFSKHENVRQAAETILELFGSAKALNNPGLRNDLLYADAARKNLR